MASVRNALSLKWPQSEMSQSVQNHQSETDRRNCGKLSNCGNLVGVLTATREFEDYLNQKGKDCGTWPQKFEAQNWESSRLQQLNFVDSEIRELANPRIREIENFQGRKKRDGEFEPEF